MGRPVGLIRFEALLDSAFAGLLGQLDSVVPSESAPLSTKTKPPTPIAWPMQLPMWCANNGSSALTFPTTASLGSQLLAHTTTAPGGITPSPACQDFRRRVALRPRRTKPCIRKSSVADVALTSFANRRDWQKFSEFYLDPESSGSLMGSAARRPVGRPACTGPIKYTGHAALQADIANLKKAMTAAGVIAHAPCSRNSLASVRLTKQTSTVSVRCWRTPLVELRLR
jgi:hypothetical protein